MSRRVVTTAKKWLIPIGSVAAAVTVAAVMRVWLRQDELEIDLRPAWVNKSGQAEWRSGRQFSWEEAVHLMRRWTGPGTLEVGQSHGDLVFLIVGRGDVLYTVQPFHNDVMKLARALDPTEKRIHAGTE